MEQIEKMPRLFLRQEKKLQLGQNKHQIWQKMKSHPEQKNKPDLGEKLQLG